MRWAFPNHMWQLLRQYALRVRPYRSYSTKPPSAEDVFKRKILQQEREKARRAPEWEKREQTLRKRYGQWNPTHKLSRQQMNDIRELKQQAPHIKTIQISDHFNVSPESIRRILKSKWVPREDELQSLEQRAEKRKSLSAERKKAQMVNSKGTAIRAISAHARSSNRPGRTHSGQNKSKEKDLRPRKKMPYTQGIGDFIE